MLLWIMQPMSLCITIGRGERPLQLARSGACLRWVQQEEGSVVEEEDFDVIPTGEALDASPGLRGDDEEEGVENENDSVGKRSEGERGHGRSRKKKKNNTRRRRKLTADPNWLETCSTTLQMIVLGNNSGKSRIVHTGTARRNPAWVMIVIPARLREVMIERYTRTFGQTSEWNSASRPSQGRKTASPSDFAAMFVDEPALVGKSATTSPHFVSESANIPFQREEATAKELPQLLQAHGKAPSFVAGDGEQHTMDGLTVTAMGMSRLCTAASCLGHLQLQSLTRILPPMSMRRISSSDAKMMYPMFEEGQRALDSSNMDDESSSSSEIDE